MVENYYTAPVESENPPITLKEIIQIIIRSRWWILSTTILISLGTIYVTYSTPPKYQSTALVIIEKNNRAQEIFHFGEDEFKISDEVHVIRSRIIAEDVVKELWESNKRNRLYVFGTKIFIPRGQRLRRPLKKIFSLGQWSPENNKPPQYDEPYNSNIGEQYYRNILNTIYVNSRRGTNIISITAKSPHPYEASLIANTVADKYKIRDKEWSRNESVSLKSYLQDRLNDKKREMQVVDAAIEKYKSDNEIYDLAGNVSNLLNNLTTVESQYNNNNLEINIIISQKNYFSDQLSTIEKDLASQMLSSINAQLFALRNQINEKESELIRNSTIYGSDHEAVLNTENELDNLKDKLEKKTNELVSEGMSIVDPLAHRQDLISKLVLMETNTHLLETKSFEYQLLINKYKEEIKSLPQKQSYLGKLNQEKAVLNKTYSYIRQKMEEARVSMASEPGKVRILNRADIPKRAVSPNVKKNLFIALLMGVLIGFIINLVLEYFDNSITSVEYIERKKLPVLAIIPSIKQELPSSWWSKMSQKRKSTLVNKNGKKAIGNLQRRMITHEDPKSPISEAYRSLRTSLMYTKKGGLGTIMVSSPGPGEGKTTTIINLAITYANLGKKTILVDGDLRKPVIHKVFDGNNVSGLTHYLSGVEKKLESIIHSTDIHNLDIIYNGAIPPNPSELLGSELMENMVDELKEKYDVVLFDAPPVMAVTDAVVLSRLTDQFILVVRFGSTDKNSITHSLSALSHVNTSLTGVIFNDLNKKNSYYNQNYYNYYQYYYSTEQTS